MSETTLKKLQVVIEGTSNPLQKEINKVKQSVKSMTGAVEKASKVSLGANSMTKQVKNMQDNLKRLKKDLTSGELTKGIQLEAGIRVETDEFTELRNNIEDTKIQLDSLQQKQEDLKTSGRYTEEESAEYKELSAYIEEAKAKLADLQNTQEEWKSIGVDSGGAWDQLQADMEEAKNTLQAFVNDMQDLQASGEATVQKETAAWQSNQSAIAAAESQLSRYNQTKAMMSATGTDTEYVNQGAMSNGSAIQTAVAGAKIGMQGVSQSITAMRTRVKQAIRDIPGIGRVARESAYVGSKAFQGLKAVLGTVGTAVKKTGGFFSSLIHRFKSMRGAAGGAGNSMRGLGSSAGGLGKSIFRLGNMFKMMVMRMAIQGVIQGAREGFQNLAKYSSSTNSSISSLMSSLNQLKNSFAAAFAPVLNVVVPILNTLISYVVSAVNAIGQFMAALTGSGTYIKATNVATDYAGSLDNAAASADNATAATEKYKKSLMGFDEMNTLSSQSDSSGSGGSGGTGGSGGSGSGDLFETVTISNSISQLADMFKDAWANADFTEIGKLVGEKLNAALESIPWDEIQETARKVAKSLATFLNGFIEATDWHLVGSTIAEGLNTAIEFAYTFVEYFDWAAFGTAIGDALNGIVDTLNLEKAGKNLGNTINGLCTTAINFADTFSWSGLGSKISSGINGVLNSIDGSTFGEAASKVARGALETLKTSIRETDWKKVGEEIRDALAAIDWSGIVYDIFEIIGLLLGGLAEFLGGLLGEKVASCQAYFKDQIEEAGGNIVLGIFNGIVLGCVGIGQWIIDNIFTPFIKGFKDAFGIHSPSTKMKEMGGYIIDGLIEGIKNIPQALWDAVSGLWSFVKNAWESVFGNLDLSIDAAVSLVKNGWATVKEWIGNIPGVSQLVELAKSGWTSIKEKWFSSLSKIEQGIAIVKSGWESIKKKWFSSLSNISQGIAIAKSGWTSIKKKWFSSLTAISQKIGLKKTGWTSVKKWILGGLSKLELPIKLPKIKVSWGSKTVAGFTIKYPNGFSTYATGGFPQMGEMFIANEAGPELVGKMGNKTTVANQNQITSGIKQGVYEAVTAALQVSKGQNGNGQPVINVYVGGKKVTDVVIEEVNSRTKSTGQCPILT